MENESRVEFSFNYLSFEGFEKPSAIQQRAIKPILKRRDVIAQAQSGTGKTATFSIAILQVIKWSINKDVSNLFNEFLTFSVHRHDRPRDPSFVFVPDPRVGRADPQGGFGSGRLHERPVSRLHRRNQSGGRHSKTGLWNTCGVRNTWKGLWHDPSPNPQDQRNQDVGSGWGWRNAEQGI